MAYNVFISYSTKDLAYVQHVRNHLAGYSEVKVFVSEYSLGPGQMLTQTIQKEIDDCHLFLLLWSGNAKNSDWVPQEIGIAKAKGKRILPVVLQSGIKLPAFISDLKHLDIHDKSINTLDWLKSHIFETAKNKAQTEGNLVLLGLGALLLWGLSSDD